jgi:hypothetical protein
MPGIESDDFRSHARPVTVHPEPGNARVIVSW